MHKSDCQFEVEDQPSTCLVLLIYNDLWKYRFCCYCWECFGFIFVCFIFPGMIHEFLIDPAVETEREYIEKNPRCLGFLNLGCKL